MRIESQKYYALYFIAVLFAALAIFLQVIAISTESYLTAHLAISSKRFVELTSIFLIVYSALQIPDGILFDKFGVRLMLPISIFLTFIGCILYLFSYNPFILALSRVLTGIGCSVAYISAIFIAVTSFSLKRLPIFIGILEAASTCGAILASREFRVVLQDYGWFWANGIVIGLCFLLFIGSIFLMRNLTFEKKTNVISISELFTQFLKLFKNTNLLLLTGYAFATWFVTMSFAGYWLKEYLLHMHHYSELYALKIDEIYWSSFLISSLIVGSLIKGFNHTKLTILLLAILGVISFMVMAIPILFNQLGIVLFVILAGASGCGVLLAFSLVPQIVDPNIVGTALALINTFVVLGGYIGELAFGYAVENFNINNIVQLPGIEPHYYSSLLIYPLLILIAFILILIFFIRTRRFYN